jgi:PAS domain S-box-containing protein
MIDRRIQEPVGGDNAKTQDSRMSPTTNPELDYFPGDDEMSELVRSLDWSATPLGSPENWSQALRTIVRILLANRFPQLLWWGPEYISIYNDAYRPILGRKHPWGLGRPVRECWSEIWNILKPLIDTPFNGGPATWSEDIELQINRAGFVEETHFTVAYSPVPDDTAPTGIGGVLATVHEITEKVVGQRRITILRDLSARGTEAKTAEEACIVSAAALRPHTKDIPFGLFYLTDALGKQARLAASCGVDERVDMSPPVILLEEAKDCSTWPLGLVRHTGQSQLITDLSSRFVAAPPGPWPDPPECAAILPIRSHIAHQFSGFLIVGLSSRLQFDDGYRNFLDLAASQISTAIANAQGYEEERKRIEAFAEIDRAKTAFFSNVSHEFRTPLALMLGPLEDALANRHGSLPRGVAEDLAISHRNALRLLKLVNTLLDFSRIEAGRAQASYHAVDLAALTAELASNFRSLCEKAGLEMIVHCPPFPSGAQAYVDRDMWEKIVLNLVSNAFKFTLKGQIVVQLKQANGHALLTVRDTGVGIPPTELPRMFERFHRVEHSRGRTHEGTGIGLALVQELVKLHGGKISVESVMGQGSLFMVTIPLGKSHLDPERVGTVPLVTSTDLTPAAFVEEAWRWLPDEPTEAAHISQREDEVLSGSEPGGGEQPLTKKARILWADDNADMRAYVGRLLGSQFEVEAFSNGEAALAAARIRTPDLVLTDVMMPGLDGFGLLRELRADPQLSTIPVILLSARAGEEARIESMQAGADDYLIKPFSARELFACVESHLKMARLRRETIEAASLRQVQFETLLNQAPLGVYLVDADFRIQAINPIALAAFGDIAGGIVGRDFDEIIHVLWEKKYADEMVRIFHHTLETGESYFTPDGGEYRADRGVREYYEWQIDRILLPDGRFGVVCYFRDIGDRKRAEQNANLLASIVESSDDAIISKDLNGVITSWNSGAERLFGYTAEEAIGKSITMLIPSERLDEEPRILASLRRGEWVDHFETIRVRKDGSPLNISLTISPVKDNDGTIVGASKIARDITERVRQEAALKEANADLQQFAYSASHDLQEPVRMVRAYSELLQQEFGDQLGPIADEIIQHTVEGAKRMDNLLRDLRTYMQVSATDQQPVEEIDAGETLKETLLNLQPIISESGASISVAALPRVRIRKFQLEQVFQNLIGNAIRYRNSAPPHIQIAATLHDRSWLFSVQDNGIGVDPEFQEQIFGVFKRLHSNFEYPGTGMGLAICQRIVERAGGCIWVESEPGKGSTFYFTILS